LLEIGQRIGRVSRTQGNAPHRNDLRYLPLNTRHPWTTSSADGAQGCRIGLRAAATWRAAASTGQSSGRPRDCDRQSLSWWLRESCFVVPVKGGTQDFMRLALLSHGALAPTFRGCQEIQRTSCHSGTARRAGPGNYEHLLYQYVRQAGVHGFRARGPCPRPGMILSVRFLIASFTGVTLREPVDWTTPPSRKRKFDSCAIGSFPRKSASAAWETRPLLRDWQGRLLSKGTHRTEKQRRPRLGQVGAFASRLSFR
jgi:hypothetical protein